MLHIYIVHSARNFDVHIGGDTFWQNVTQFGETPSTKTQHPTAH